MGQMIPTGVSRETIEKRKVLATQRWDQGFGTRVVAGHRRAVFVRESTCRVVADRSVAAGFAVRVDRVQDLWTFREL